jgi:hypothetical protein
MYVGTRSQENCGRAAAAAADASTAPTRICADATVGALWQRSPHKGEIGDHTIGAWRCIKETDSRHFVAVSIAASMTYLRIDSPGGVCAIVRISSFPRLPRNAATHGK